MGGHRSLLMVMVWAWVQIRRKMLGSDGHGSWLIYEVAHRLACLLASVSLAPASTDSMFRVLKNIKVNNIKYGRLYLTHPGPKAPYMCVLQHLAEGLVASFKGKLDSLVGFVHEL